MADMQPVNRDKGVSLEYNDGFLPQDQEEMLFEFEQTNAFELVELPVGPLPKKGGANLDHENRLLVEPFPSCTNIPPISAFDVPKYEGQSKWEDEDSKNE
jgi:hypothetical protein